MKTQDYIAAFDFDGVIWDSVDECFHIAYGIFKKIEGKIDLNEDELKERFRQGRYLARTCEDFFITLYMIKNRPNLDFNGVSISDYYGLRTRLKYSMIIFANEFFDERTRLQNYDFDFWFSLQRPYPGIIESLPAIRGKFKDLVICSMKDKESIRKMLSRYGHDYKTLGRDFSLDKREQISKISSDYKISTDKIIFIDDLMENLTAVRETGSKVLMAGWGYNNETERQKAVESGIKILTLEEMISAKIPLG